MTRLFAELRRHYRFPTYALFYRELDACWLVAGLLPCVIDPDTLQAQLLIREIGNGG